MQVSFGSCRLDLDRRQLFRNEREVRLTPKAFELLRLLVMQRPRALSKTELTDHIWKGTFITDDGLPRLVNELRAALGDPAREPRYIRTVHGYGYAFAADAELIGSPAVGACTLSWGSKEFRLGDGVRIIGRDPNATVCFDSTLVSRQHAQIIVEGLEAHIEDLGSKNGTLVNDMPLLSSQRLSDGDQIQVGDFTLTFHSLAAVPTETRR